MPSCSQGRNSHVILINLECLRRILSSIGKDKLPKKLFINTCKDNKKFYFFGYCAYLTVNRYFLVIEIYFLPVGHTHGQIDQMFSVFILRKLFLSSCIVY